MQPDARRAAIITATLPLVLEHGRAVTTRQVAQAAGIAEGTIFRVFLTKDELFEAVLEQALDFEPYVLALEALDRGGDLDDVVTRVAALMIDRFDPVFRLLTVLEVKGPPPFQRKSELLDRVAAAHEELLAPHADALTLPPREVFRYVRLLVFSGSHPHLTDGRRLTAPQIASLVLDGCRKVP